MYPYKDHLGNIRINYAWDDEANELKVLNEHHYYLFGLEHATYNPERREFKRGESNNHPIQIIPVENAGYQYKYQGQEYQDELDLNVYDYQWRAYDPAIARFNKVDRFAEKYYSESPYHFTTNNPILFREIKGDTILIYSKKDNYYVKYQNGNLFSKNTKTGKWGAYNGKYSKTDKNGNTTVGGFLGKTKDALDNIRGGGNTGSELVGYLQNATKYIRIKKGSNSSTGVAGGVKWSPNDRSGGADMNGNTSRDSYIGLAHELGHAYDGLDGQMSNVSMGVINGKTIPANELTAMHWENRIRGENGVSLRPFYGTNASGVNIGQNLNSNGNSLNFNQQKITPSAHIKRLGLSTKIVPVNIITVIPFVYK